LRIRRPRGQTHPLPALTIELAKAGRSNGVPLRTETGLEHEPGKITSPGGRQG